MAEKDPASLITDENGNEFKIPVEGSLGLLALGAVGLKAWRKARRAAMKDKDNVKENDGNTNDIAEKTEE